MEFRIVPLKINKLPKFSEITQGWQYLKHCVVSDELEFTLQHKSGLFFRKVNLLVHLRLHQPVKNPISDNSNILWNSPSLGRKFQIQATLTFQKTTLVYHLKEKK